MRQHTGVVIRSEPRVCFQDTFTENFRIGDRVRVAALLFGNSENGLEMGAEGAEVGVSVATGVPLVEFLGWQNGHDGDQGDGALNRWWAYADRIALERMAENISG